MCLCVWEFMKKRSRYWECVCVVCLLLSLLIRLAVWPKPEILVITFWIKTHDLSAAGKLNVRKLGLIRNTRPTIPVWDHTQVYMYMHVYSCTHTHTLFMHVFSISADSKSHWPTYLLSVVWIAAVVTVYNLISVEKVLCKTHGICACFLSVCGVSTHDYTVRV